MPNNNILWSPRAGFNGISQEIKQNKFVEEQEFYWKTSFGLEIK
jgi:hypothetical protein